MAQAEPFIKWVGGKRSVIPEIEPRLPKTFNNYWEPFIGGGALFYHLKGAHRDKDWHISDINKELVATYLQVQKDPEALIEALRQHARRHEAKSPWRTQAGKQVKDPDGYYYQVRSDEPSDQLAVAARFIYLNRTCFNGLHRVNSRGKFNVPAGKYKNPEIIQAERLRACHEALRGVEIKHQAYTSIEPETGDLVYFDPPYDIWDAATFTKYSAEDFGWEDQVRLWEFACHLRDRGVKVALSNHATGPRLHQGKDDDEPRQIPGILKLYEDAGFRTHVFGVRRAVAAKASSRAAVEEVLITSY